MKENRLKVNLLLLLPLAVLFLSSVLPRSSADAEAGYVRRRQLRGENVTVDPTFAFPNSHLRDAYIALQALKLAIISDPLNLTADWVGPGVCNYTGVYCAPLPSDPRLTVVAGVDLNHGDIAGYLPDELGLLSDLSLFHINSNRFCGTVPLTFHRLRLLFELVFSFHPVPLELIKWEYELFHGVPWNNKWEYEAAGGIRNSVGSTELFKGVWGNKVE